VVLRGAADAALNAKRRRPAVTPAEIDAESKTAKKKRKKIPLSAV
jgi:hypothetical protein